MFVDARSYKWHAENRLISLVERRNGDQHHGGAAVFVAWGAAGLFVPRINLLPAKTLFQMLGEGLLDKPVFGVDVREGHGQTGISM